MEIILARSGDEETWLLFSRLSYIFSKLIKVSEEPADTHLRDFYPRERLTPCPEAGNVAKPSLGDQEAGLPQ